MAYFWTADTHFGHANIMKYCDRKFNSVHDMNVELTRAWNNTVSKDDTIYFLGDLCLNKKKIVQHLLNLNGRLIYIPGNHDSQAEKIIRAAEKELGIPLAEKITPLLSTKIDGYHITMCHYAMRVWNKSHYGTIQLYGHSHAGLPPEGRQLDVGVDNAFKLLGEYRPFSLEEVLQFVPKKRQRNHHGK